MNQREVPNDSRKTKPFKFSDTFMAGFKSLISTYDKKIEDLNRVRSLIDSNTHHGVCNCSYKMRYITPSDVSTFISNLERAMENHLFKPQTSDCDLFAVESVKRFLKGNKCVPFDAPTIMGNPGADIPRGATLADLTFAAESECFNLIVYSKYELEKRIDCMKEDIDTMQKMHFSAAIKQFVQHLPGIMDKKASFVMQDSLLSKACEVYIEDFIIFAVRLNLCTVLQMLDYAVPTAAYNTEPKSYQSNESANNADNWDEDNDFFQMESVDMSKAAPIYFIFSKGRIPILSNTIRIVTHSEYSHASIAFDASLNPMYSFGGDNKNGTYPSSKWGFKKEDIHDKAYNNIEVAVYAAYIDRTSIEKLKSIVQDFESHRTKFDIRLLLNKLAHIDFKPSKNKYKQVCSTFVDYLMNEVGIKKGNKNIMSPEDIRASIAQCKDSAFEVYDGSANDYSPKKIEKKTESEGKKKNSRRFDEVVTECCTGFLKTNDYMITNKIPFNCNMRDIVLQDMHPQFKDTISALKFIMNDERSPVHQLVIQYYTEPIDEYDPDMIIKLFFGCPRNNHWECYPNSRDALANNAANMNTDVNWLDKITYGNMFYDGNYRRDGLGNQHTHPIMNSFETIYKMFGGCDNICDNAGLSNSLIRISRVMKAIVERYCDGGIPNWEMCRDILSVFGEIFTRHMLRLYYNNDHYAVIKDQMPDTIIPGYMYSEYFVQEAGNVVSNSDNNYSKTGKAKVFGSNMIKTIIDWFANKLSKFLPEHFKSAFEKHIEWFNKNGQAKFEEIANAVNSNKYKLPKLKKYYKYNITFNPTKVSPKDTILKYMEADFNEDKQMELRKALFSVFNDSSNLPEELAKRNGEELKKAAVNAILFSKIDDNDCILTDYQLKNVEEIKSDIFQPLQVMAQTPEGCKTWNEGFDKLSKQIAEAVTELEKSVIKTDNSDKSNEGGEAAKDTGEGGAAVEAKAKSTRAQAIIDCVKDIGNAFYSVCANTIVSQLFPNVYNDFRGIINDCEAATGSGSDNKEQTTNNAENAENKS